MMNVNNEWKELKSTLSEFSIWAITSIIDGLFIIIWVVIQYGVGRVINALKLDGIDRIVLYIFQFLFAISTLAPVAITIYRDIRIKLLRMKKSIRLEEGTNQE